MNFVSYVEGYEYAIIEAGITSIDCSEFTKLKLMDNWSVIKGREATLCLG